jgi:hypothetical protein
MRELALFAGAPMKTHWKSSEYAREKAKAWRLANPDRVLAYRKENRRDIYLTESARRYGITREQYAAMLEKQRDACATCALTFDWGDKQTKPHIDHCHATGKVRGLLCNRCNTMLGLVKENKRLLAALTEYLECHG